MLFLLLTILMISTKVLVLNASRYGGASVDLFEWSWDDVANECENFLYKKGYKAVQVSPPNEHIQGNEWWTRYQPVTYKIISRSGNETQFDVMVSRCTALGIQVIVDAVINHMAAGSGKGIAGSSYGSRSYPYYSPNDFHHDSNNIYNNCQVNNYYDKYNVQYCDLSGLPDLMTSSPYVQSQIAGYLNNLYQKGVRGLRIDAVKHQDANELNGILKRLPSDLYIGQEVIGSSDEAVQPNMYYDLGQVSEFYYADYLDPNIINENKMIYLKTFGESWGLMPDYDAVGFLDNHDTQRNGRAQLTYKNGALYVFANIFMLSWPYSNVRVMSSYYFTNTDQGPPSVGVANGLNCQDGKNWVCEHRIIEIANMVNWRNAAGTSEISNWQQGNSNQIAFSRNSKAFIAFNRGSNSNWMINTLSTGLPAGNYCNIIKSDDTNVCDVIIVNNDGQVHNLSIPPLSAIAIHVNCMKK